MRGEEFGITKIRTKGKGWAVEERRKHPRLRVPWEVEIELGGAFRIRMTPDDIGRGGACVRLPAYISPGEQCRVVICARPNQPIEVEAVVRWVGEQDAIGFAKAGLEFCLRGKRSVTDTLLGQH
jgi:hypothetical protein